MECHAVQEKLSAYIEGNISSQERMLVDEHLKSCVKCNGSLAELKKTISYIHNLEDIEPPAWMTQKIMAKIKAEAGTEKVIWKKLFYPLHIKLPVEAVAVILIAITTVYIFKTIQPETKFTKVPSEETSSQIFLEQRETSQRKQADKLTEIKEKGSKKGIEAEQPLSAGKSETADMESKQSKVPELFAKQDEAAPSAAVPTKGELKREALPAVPQPKVSEERKKDSIDFIVNVKNRETAGKEIVKAVRQFNGRITRTESLEGKDILTAEIDSRKLRDLIETIKLSGSVEKEEKVSEGREGVIEIRIEIVNEP